MPYVNKLWRARLDPLLEPLVREIMATTRAHASATIQAGQKDWREPSEAELTASMTGIFNYVITALAVTLTGTPRYFKCAALRAAMADASEEYYRRLVAPYEDKQAKLNGDVFP